MKFFYSFSFLLLIGFVAINSCSEKTSVVAETVENTEEHTDPPLVEQRTVTGSFQSVTGVMDELSCYCSNGGYVTADDGVKTAVCFDETVESCDKITVTGYMTSRSIESNGPCPAGIMGFLKAQSYIVGETDY